MNSITKKPSNHQKSFNWKLIPLFILCLYLTVEIITYLLICANIWRPDFMSVVSKTFSASDRPYTRFDSISGYKYIGSEPRLTNIIGDTIQYNHIMHVNNMGYSSIYNYSYAKKPGVVRWMVLGASFSAGEITDTTWVDLLQKKVASDSIELYNFSLEASGICNWHNIFFKEIVPAYKFDGVILAVNGDLHPLSYDIARPVYCIKHSFEDHTGLGFFTNLPENEASFETEYTQQLIGISYIYDSATLNIYKKQLTGKGDATTHFRWMPVRAYFANYLWQAVHLVANFKRFYKIYHLPDIDHKILRGDYTGKDDYNALFGLRNMQKVAEILSYCVKNNKKIYLISVPSGTIAQLDTVGYNNNLYNRHLKQLAEKYNGGFFDGYRIFDSIPTVRWNDFHLYNDGHWNRAGIDRFLTLFYRDNSLNNVSKH